MATGAPWTERTRYGGSEAFSRLERDPRLKRIFAGYAFALDYREERGHAYSLKDQDQTDRVKQRPQPGSCLHCHASIIPAHRRLGSGDLMKGFEIVCATPFAEARKLVAHPVVCIDCQPFPNNRIPELAHRFTQMNTDLVALFRAA